MAEARSKNELAQFIDAIPHMRELGLETLEMGNGVAVMRLPYQERLIGNPETGVLHGGVVTTLIDSVCGMAVLSGMAEHRPFVTLDLRIDYVRPAVPGQALLARAECYKYTSLVTFIRGTAYHETPDDPVASAAGTFMMLPAPAKPAGGGGQAKTP